MYINHHRSDEELFEKAIAHMDVCYDAYAAGAEQRAIRSSTAADLCLAELQARNATAQLERFVTERLCF